MKTVSMATLALTAGLFLAPVVAQQATQKAPEHHTPMPQSVGKMDHGKMMADMKAADARLEALVKAMKSATGHDQLSAMENVVAALVQNQIDMHRHMSMMHDHMMSQMPHK